MKAAPTAPARTASSSTATGRDVHALLIAFANGREYGIGARIAPMAELDDGWLDAFVVDERAVLARFWHARHLALGTAHLAPNVTAERVRHAVIDAPGPIDFHVDGEPAVAHDRVEVSIRPGALHVRVGLIDMTERELLQAATDGRLDDIRRALADDPTLAASRAAHG